MTNKQLLGLLATGSLAALLSCDSAPDATAGGLDANDCPLGTFRPIGLTDCVFPATDVFGQALGVSDNRCAQSQGAVPPQCVTDSGGRAYLSATGPCAPGYRFLPGACNRNGGTPGTGFGTGGAGTTGAAGTFTGDAVGTAGAPSSLGEAGMGFTTGAAGTTGSAGTTAVAGTNGAAGS